MRAALFTSFISFIALAFGCATSDQDKLQPLTDARVMTPGVLEVEIQPPAADLHSTGEVLTLDVEGVASAIGGVRHLDIMLVLDRSTSLKKTDPEDHRVDGAIGFVEGLSPKSDTLIGVVGFDGESELLQALTADRGAAVNAIEGMKRSGGTNIAAGMLTALAELETHGRPDSSRMIMLFTDGKSNQRKAREATREAQARGITVHTLLLGTNEGGAAILEEIALGTGGSFVQVSDPAELPAAFLNLRTTGVDQVTLSANGQTPIPARLTGGTFVGQVPLEVGDNRIVARATSLDDQTKDAVINVKVHDASCAALDVAATYEGLPAVSINERAVQIVIDASRSMWGRMDGEPKMEVARNILLDAADWMPQDLDLALRAYGSVSPTEQNDCTDSTLLVPFGADSRDSIRTAVTELRPRGQTPIAHALEQAANDFAELESERTLVLVTDGIESCGGDPVAAAHALREQGLAIHVIGFGMGTDENTVDEDVTSLGAIAEAGGGMFLTAGSAAELKTALEATVATRYRVLQGETVVAESQLGSDEQFFLPEGRYRIELDSVPPQAVDLSLAPRDALTLTLAKTDGAFSHSEHRALLEPTSCEASVAWTKRTRDGRPSISAVSNESAGGDGRAESTWDWFR